MQIIERENRKDEIIRNRLKEQGLDPYDESNKLAFRRYKGNY